MKYFNNCKTKQDAKKLFRELAKTNHPDKGGSNDIMVEIINEYEKVMKKLASDPKSTHEDMSEEQFQTFVSKEMQEILDNISHLPIEIEIIGTWIWVGGNTYPYKSYLTAYNFIWCSTKKMYQWHLERKKGYRGKPQDIEKIRANYGSKKVVNKYRMALA